MTTTPVNSDDHQQTTDASEQLQREQTDQEELRRRYEEQQRRLAVQPYIGILESNVALAGSFLTEILGVGARALTARRDVHGRFAQMLRVLVERASVQTPEIGPLSEQMAMAIVGGINEMLLDTFDSGEDDLEGVAVTAFSMVRAIVIAAPSAGPV